jgi:hypothetical protein
VNTPLDVAPRPSSHLPPAPADEELSLAELLALFSPEEVATTSMHRSLRSSGARLRGWAQDSSRRAARWGAVAGVVEVHGGLSSRSVAKGAQ